MRIIQIFNFKTPEVKTPEVKTLEVKTPEVKTKIFNSFKEFLSRSNKSINGVTANFAENNANYIEINQSNMGCWDCINCINCIGCNDCQNCQNCQNCHNCHNCLISEQCCICKNSSHCNFCTNCTNCNSCTSCTNCKNCKFSVNCNSCKLSGNCYHCTKCRECSNCLNCFNCMVCINLQNCLNCIRRCKDNCKSDEKVRNISNSIESDTKTKQFIIGQIVSYKGGRDWYRIRSIENTLALIQHINSKQIIEVYLSRLRIIPISTGTCYYQMMTL